MMKKVLFMALTILLTLSLVGCGGGDTPAEKPAQEKKDVTADKAIVTYAELLMTGESATAGDLGLTDAEKAEIVNFIAKESIEMGGNAIPLSEKSAQTIADKMHEKFKQHMKFTATIKKDDAEHPVVEIKTAPLIASSANSEEIIKEATALVEMNTQLQESGSTPDQIRENSNFQAMAIKVCLAPLESYVPGEEKAFEIKCTKVNGHWAPENVKDLYYLLTGADLEAIKAMEAQQK